MTNNEIKDLIKDILNKTDELSGDIVINEEIHKDGNTTTWFLVEVKNPSPILSKEGEGLSALNHLIHRIIENKIPQGEEFKKKSFLIDVNGFQKKKIESIHALAHMMAERSRYFKSSIEMEPMSAFERRIVHEFLSNEADLKTESEGIGPYRKVVIKYIGLI